MNILFLTYRYPEPEKGGAERTIYKLSKYFLRNDIYVHVAFLENENVNIVDHYSGYFRLNKNLIKDQLKKYIIDNKIDIVIIFIKYCHEDVLISIKECGCKLIVSLRFAPEDTQVKISRLLEDKERFNSYKWKIKRAFKFIYLNYSLLQARKKIQLMYKYADRYLIGSKRSLQSFKNIYKIKDSSKVLPMSNALSFDVSLPYDELSIKKKQVLIVARMEEKVKRIFLALDIWKEVQTIYKSDWEFIIVGDGLDLQRYKDYVKNETIRNVKFMGKRNPEVFYKESSIFLMTSAIEGLGNTVIEAQQMGCVPIAFDSFEPVHDIITNGKNGIIVKNNDVPGYVNQLIFLMKNNEERLKLARNAIDECQKFSLNNIGSIWRNLFLELITSEK